MSYLNRENNYGESESECRPTQVVHPAENEAAQLRKRVAQLKSIVNRAQKLADSQLVDHTGHVTEDGQPCGLSKTWKERWARDLHCILNESFEYKK